jgi:hypothetical protein
MVVVVDVHLATVQIHLQAVVVMVASVVVMVVPVLEAGNQLHHHIASLTSPEQRRWLVIGGC